MCILWKYMQWIIPVRRVCCVRNKHNFPTPLISDGWENVDVQKHRYHRHKYVLHPVANLAAARRMKFFFQIADDWIVVGVKAVVIQKAQKAQSTHHHFAYHSDTSQRAKQVVDAMRPYRQSHNRNTTYTQLQRSSLIHAWKIINISTHVE